MPQLARRIANRHGLWLSSIGVAAFALTLMALAFPAPEHEFTPLRGEPSSGTVYFIGNSMFGTGIDISLVRSILPEEKSSLAYYDGHYTNMWYAAFRNSLIPAGIKPKVVVWGFRPTYADHPAFRQTIRTDLDLLLDENDRTYAAVIRNATESTPDDSALNKERLSFESQLADEITARAPLIRRRSEVKNAVNLYLRGMVAQFFSSGNETAAVFASAGTELKISDAITSFVSGGRVRRADATVVDAAEKLIRGRQAAFADSFIPLTAKLLEDAEIPQLVIIFKPAWALQGKMPASTMKFYHDAIDYFDEHGIPYVDFIADSQLTIDLYASGDHYNQAGMRYVTEKVVHELRAKGLVE